MGLFMYLNISKNTRFKAILNGRINLKLHINFNNDQLNLLRIKDKIKYMLESVITTGSGINI